MQWNLLNAQAKTNAQRCECAYGMLEALRARHNNAGRTLDAAAFRAWKAAWWRPRNALAVAAILSVRDKALSQQEKSSDTLFVARKAAWKASTAYPVDLDGLAVTPGVPPADPYEDLTTFTEVDSASDLTLSATTCTINSMRRDANSYVYKSYGASHFTNYEHDFEAKFTSADAGSDVIVWGCTNDYGAFVDMSNGQIVYHSRTSDGLTYRYLLYDRGNSNYDLGAVSINTAYYFTVGRSGTTGTCEIYSDSGRTSLVDTLAATVQNTAWQYLMCCGSINSGTYGDRAQTGYSKNFDIKEAAAVVRHRQVIGGGLIR
ncbi:MAG TPA: hypothetical protein PLE19_12765 [Planctomycetota bacterium]|nr:hypothetical protein [Planctomycetota bacterium]HRT95763.1 hypothetical protein [Planctomycetota bacterium]